MDDKLFIATMELIVAALKEKGYEPYEQLTGYITENEPCYITKHKNARQLILNLDIEHVKQYLRKMKHY